mmetsp:Transcript_8697/g.14263  ORF Transcript_8697/g.14263 Transcript_8697/m.14263 type:complete len:418 (-) Transcript_8697:143-1396(-)|eukprot:CAMPEP_0184650222 /NCGR_PEP_ID=MMETSP0308-20130426/7746_1 /TAXON_ID=38269 /ORGANISM="Gloeochaete witrockiana, Strain SAG 46.84" /LENGTH=417 /DNA_ID=CAMNT_0027083599 /DNA_START=597 /DNA_END=1850 /DNA_ORIENTATION=-
MTDSLSFDQLAKLFHMPLSDAAKEIGICCTALKKACRKNNITRWPHRKVKSLDRMIEGLEAKASEAPNSEEADKVMIELEYYKNQRGLIMKNTGSHRATDKALKMKPTSAISKGSCSSGSLSSSSSFYGNTGAASSPLSSSVSSPSNVLGFGLSHHGLAASSSSSSSSSGSPSSGSADSSSSPEMYQPSPADSELFDNLIFASEFNQQQQQQSQLQFQQQQMAQHYQDLFQQQLAIMQMPEFCTPAASAPAASQQQTASPTAGPFFPKPAGPSFPSQQQQQQQVVSPQNLFYFQQPMMDGKNGAFMNPQFMYNFSPNAMPFMPNPMSAFMFPFGYPFPSFPMASNQSPVDFSAQNSQNQNQLRSFPASAALPALSTPEPSYSAESPSFFRNSDALDALFVKQEGNFDSSLPEFAQAF